jgi:hypothetical protein
MRLLVAFALLVAAAGGCSSDGDDSTSPDGGPTGADADTGDRPDGGPTADPGCGPHNCDGCCDGDECRPGSGDDECGSGGAACQACGEWGVCTGGVVCEVAPDSLWDIEIESATVSDTNRAGNDWDGDGDLPDVFTRLRYFHPADGAIEVRTEAIEDLTPAWNQTVAADVRGASLEGMVFTLFDEDDNADDAFGACHAAVRLEDLETGVVELECPRSFDFFPDGAFTFARSGWSLRYRLIPGSEPRPGAAPLDRRALPTRDAAGACTVTEEFAGDSRFTTYDEAGRIISFTTGLDTIETRTCVAEDRCENSSGQLQEFYRLEPGPFGMRERVHDNRLSSSGGDPHFPAADVSHHDSLGRLVLGRGYLEDGSPTGQSRNVFTAAQKESFAGNAAGTNLELQETTTFDERGSPVRREGALGATQVFEFELNGAGLPIKQTIVASDIPENVGLSSTFTYVGSGCADALASTVTNGGLRP